MLGLVLVVLCVMVSLFAYLIAPDNSTSANEHILQLGTHPPRFRITVLKLPKPGFEHKNIIDKLINGFPKDYTVVPVVSYSVKNDTLHYTEYRGVKFLPEPKWISLNELNGKLPDELIEERVFWLGTDRFGRDILSRLIIGTRVSLSVGLISVIISLLIGVTFGAIAGYFRGWLDECILWVINVFWSIPTLLLAMGLYISAGSLIENKLVMIFIAVGLTMWVETARIVRGQFLSVREMEFVSAAKSLGFGHFRIIFRHILPNILGPIIVVACANFASSILVESGLSYIGLGIQPPAPSWGSMLNEYKEFLDTDKAYLALYPGISIVLLVLAFNLVGNGLRDALDVKGQLE